MSLHYLQISCLPKENSELHIGGLKTGGWSTESGKSNPTKSHSCGELTDPAFNKPLPTVDFAHSPLYIP